MEPIEQDLEDRKARARRWAIELQTLEMQPEPQDPAGWAEHETRLAELQHKLDAARSAIRELEEIVAEGRHPRRIPRPPSAAHSRRLTQEERDEIARDTLEQLRDSIPNADLMEIRVHVGQTTDAWGHPEVRVSMEPKRKGRA